LKDRLFLPLGMRSAVPEFDTSGTWIASSYLHATARDYARFGLLYLRNGFWDGKQLIPRDWAENACKPHVEGDQNPSKGQYGELFWLNRRDGATGAHAVSDDVPENLCFARGFGGQVILIAPDQDTVVVMLNGTYTDDASPVIRLLADIL